MEERNLNLTLPDGRSLSYNTFGDPFAAARSVAGAIPRSDATWLPGEGHLSWTEAHAGEIVRALLSVGVKEVISTDDR